MFVTCQTANRRRMHTQSGCAADRAVYHGGQHLSLEPRHRRVLPQVKIVVDPTNRDAYSENRQYKPEYSRDNSVLASGLPENQPPDASGLVFVDRNYPGHVASLSLLIRLFSGKHLCAMEVE